MAQLKDLIVNGASRFIGDIYGDKATLTGDIVLTASNTDSPSLIFNRTASGYVDWRMLCTAGKLSFQSATDGSTWTERAYFASQAGDLILNSVTANSLTATTLLVTNSDKKITSLASANNDYNNKYQTLMSNGTSTPTWTTTLNLTGNGIPVLSVSDLDDLTTPGTYRVNNNAAWSSVAHKPTALTSGARVITFAGHYLNSSTYWYGHQFIMGSQPGYLFHRAQNQNTGQSFDSSWYRIVQAADTTSTIGSASQPVYLNSSGMITAIDGAIDNDTTGNANSATKVTQLASANTAAAYRILLSTSAADTEEQGSLHKDTDLRWNPSTNTLDIAASNANGIIKTTSGKLTLDAAATIYINNPNESSVIFTNGGADTDHEYARFNTKGNLILSSIIDTVNDITYKLYVNGTSYFGIGNPDGVAQKKFIVYGNNRYLSIGASGLQAYTSATNGTIADGDTKTLLYLQYNGGDTQFGQSTSIPSHITHYGNILPGANNTYTLGSTGTTGKAYSNVVSYQFQLYDITNNRTSGKLLINTLSNAANTEGVSQLTLGNSTAVGTVGNYSGQILLYSSGTGGHLIQPSITATNSTRVHYLPNVSGWIAIGGNGTTTGAGSETQPVYLSTNGVLTPTNSITPGSFYVYYSGSTSTYPNIYVKTGIILESTSTSIHGSINIPGYTDIINGPTVIYFKGYWNKDSQQMTYCSAYQTTNAISSLSFLVCPETVDNTTQNVLYLQIGRTIRYAAYLISIFKASEPTKNYIVSSSTTAPTTISQTADCENTVRLKNIRMYRPRIYDGAGSTSRYKIIDFYNHSNNLTGSLVYDSGSTTNVTSGRFMFYEYSPKTTAATSTTGYYEWYALPAAATGLSGNVGYDILTTKNTVTVAQGGTGKDSWTAGGVVYASASTTLAQDSGVTIDGTNHVLKGAAWNDYAEYRQSEIKEPGRVITEIGNDQLRLTATRLERGCEIISDTFGFAIGETNDCQTPIAASGRVLAYPYESREEFASHIGWPVCSGPNGTVSIMTEEEEEKYPSRIIGTISAVPDYEEWGSGNIKVNGRVWIRIR